MTYLSTAQAATEARLTPGSFRKAMTRARAAGVDVRAPRDQWPDARTPLWDADRLGQWAAGRPRASRP